MAQLAFTVGGAFVGSLFGMPQLGAMVGGMIGSALFGPTMQGPRMTDLTVTASTYGNAIPELYGTSRMSGNLIWTSGIKETKKKSGGGKGGPKQVSYTYSASFAVAFCKGPVDNVLRLWADSKLIYGDKIDITKLSNGELITAALAGNGKKKKRIKYRFYRGDEAQSPDSIIEAKEGAGNVPAYRGLCYIVFEDMPLEDYGNRIPSITAELTKASLLATVKRDPAPTLATTSYSFIDYENREGYYVSASGLQVVDLQSNTVVRTLPDVKSLPDKGCFTPGGEFYVRDEGTTNSRKIVFYDGHTMQKVGERGNYANALSESPVQTCLGYHELFNGGGQIGAFRVLKDDKMIPHFINLGFFGSYSIYEMFGGFKIFGNFTYGEASFIQLKEENKHTEVGAYRNHSQVGFVIDVFSVKDKNDSTIECAPDGPPNCFNPGATTCTATPDSNTTHRTMIVTGTDGQKFFMTGLAYDKADDGLILLGNLADGRFCTQKVIVETGETKWEHVYPLDSDIVGPALSNVIASNVNGDSLGWIGDYKFVIIDANSGLIKYHLPAPIFYGYGAAWDSETYSFTGTFFDEPVSPPKSRIFIRDGSNTVTVGGIVRDICTRTGSLDDADIDTTEVDGIPVKGYVISRETTAKDCLSQLASAFFFDGVESDYQLKFKLRGGASVATLTQTQIGNVENKDVQVKAVRAQDLDMPMRVTVNYFNKDRDYQQGSQYQKRLTNPFPTMHSHNEQKIELPIVFDADEAKQVADKTLMMVWTNRVTANALLPWRFLRFDPADVITINLDNGTSYNLRLTKVDLGVDYSIKTEGQTESAVAYTSNVKGDGGQVPLQQAGDPSPASMIILNTPLLRDKDDTVGAGSISYVSAFTKNGTFKGAYAMESKSGEDYNNVSYISVDATAGYCVNALPKTNAWGATDTVTTLNVRLYGSDDTLSSITRDQLLAGSNLASVGDEVIQFQNAVLNDDGSWTLSNILRARRGTSYAVRDHTAGERFVLLTETTLDLLTRGNDELDATRYYKAVPPGSLTEDAIGIGVKFEPRDLAPYTVERVRATDDGTNVTVTFLRRNRLSSPLNYASRITYREGQGVQAHVKYAVFNGYGIDQQPWTLVNLTPETGNVLIFNSDNSLADLQFQFPLGDVLATANKTFTVLLQEVGYADGLSKIVEFKYVAPNQWNATELY